MSYHQLRFRHHTARKTHRCIWCGEPIPPGEKYWREVSTYDGDFQNHAWHEECQDDFGQYCDAGETEFTPYSAPRPERAIKYCDASETEFTLYSAPRPERAIK